VDVFLVANRSTGHIPVYTPRIHPQTIPRNTSYLFSKIKKLAQGKDTYQEIRSEYKVKAGY